MFRICLQLVSILTICQLLQELWSNLMCCLSQELKNLRPQLYSAAEYCEKSYLQNEQKQMQVYCNQLNIFHSIFHVSPRFCSILIKSRQKLIDLWLYGLFQPSQQESSLCLIKLQNAGAFILGHATLFHCSFVLLL